jgi:ABC-type sugar transport system permease subunit
VSDSRQPIATDTDRMSQISARPGGAMTPTIHHKRVKPAGSSRKRGKSDTVIALAMLAPALVLLSIFVLWPLINAGRVSFYKWSFYEQSVFVGFDNFRQVLNDPKFFASIGRGLLFAAIVVPIQLTIAFLFASLTKTMGRRMATVLKVAIFIPTTVSFVVAAIVFTIIYSLRRGILNWFVGFFGIEDQAWIGNADTALYALTVPAIWIGLGIASLIMLAALLDIPESYYEAAELDGANWFQKTWYITLPMLRNIILYLSIVGYVATLQQTDLPLVMTQGGPVDSTTLPNVLLFNHFRNDQYLGYPIAGALLVLLVLGTVSILIFRLMPSEKAVDS